MEIFPALCNAALYISQQSCCECKCDPTSWANNTWYHNWYMNILVNILSEFLEHFYVCCFCCFFSRFSVSCIAVFSEPFVPIVIQRISNLLGGEWKKNFFTLLQRNCTMLYRVCLFCLPLAWINFGYRVLYMEVFYLFFQLVEIDGLFVCESSYGLRSSNT